MKSLYEILGLKNFSSLEDIKKVYRKLALKYHPDKEGGNLKIMQDINHAYDILTKKKSAYDNWLQNQIAPKITVVWGQTWHTTYGTSVTTNNGWTFYTI